ncbi:MAG: glycosyltransferase [Bacilli bacterium]|nr:glycosyltransferase [Bacilli bacterium]
MNLELVSVIIPTYKTNHSLNRAIDSVLNQTYKNVEIIVVDDNGQNSKYRKITEDIMEKYKEKKNISFIFHEKNKNGSAARNTGVKESNGKYISFLDDDDYYLKDKIKKEIDFICNNKLKFCTCYYYRNKRIYKFDEKDDYTEDVFYNKVTPQTSSFLITKKLFNELKGFDESYFRHQDYEFLLRVMEKTKVGVIPEPLYVMSNNGVINTPSGKKLEEIKNKFLKDFNYIIVSRKLNMKKIYSKNYSTVFYSYLKNKDLKNAKRIAIKYNSYYFWGYLIRRFLKSIEYKMRG